MLHKALLEFAPADDCHALFVTVMHKFPTFCTATRYQEYIALNCFHALLLPRPALIKVPINLLVYAKMTHPMQSRSVKYFCDSLPEIVHHV